MAPRTQRDGRSGASREHGDGKATWRRVRTEECARACTGARRRSLPAPTRAPAARRPSAARLTSAPGAVTPSSSQVVRAAWPRSRRAGPRRRCGRARPLTHSCTGVPATSYSSTAPSRVRRTAVNRPCSAGNRTTADLFARGRRQAVDPRTPDVRRPAIPRRCRWRSQRGPSGSGSAVWPPGVFGRADGTDPGASAVGVTPLPPPHRSHAQQVGVERDPADPRRPAMHQRTRVRGCGRQRRASLGVRRGPTRRTARRPRATAPSPDEVRARRAGWTRPATPVPSTIRMSRPTEQQAMQKRCARHRRRRWYPAGGRPDGTGRVPPGRAGPGVQVFVLRFRFTVQEQAIPFPHAVRGTQWRRVRFRRIVVTESPRGGPGGVA